MNSAARATGLGLLLIVSAVSARSEPRREGEAFKELARLNGDKPAVVPPEPSAVSQKEPGCRNLFDEPPLRELLRHKTHGIMSFCKPFNLNYSSLYQELSSIFNDAPDLQSLAGEWTLVGDLFFQHGSWRRRARVEVRTDPDGLRYSVTRDLDCVPVQNKLTFGDRDRSVTIAAPAHGCGIRKESAKYEGYGGARSGGLRDVGFSFSKAWYRCHSLEKDGLLIACQVYKRGHSFPDDFSLMVYARDDGGESLDRPGSILKPFVPSAQPAIRMTRSKRKD